MEKLILKIRQEYEDITALIDAEIQKDIAQSMAALIFSEQGEDEKRDSAADRSARKLAHEIAMISLLSLRIKTGCELVRYGEYSEEEQLRQDAAQLVSNVKKFEYEWEISEPVRCDAYDFLNAVCPTADKNVIDQIYDWNLSGFTRNEISAEMFFLFTKSAQYLRKINRISEAVQLLELLCRYSRERSNPDHKELIYRVVSQIGDDSLEAICRIGDLDGTIFFGDMSLQASDFYWFYGSGLIKSDRTEEASYILEKCFDIRKKILGERNYYTELVRRELAICRFSLTAGREGGEDLRRFVDRIAAGNFEGESDPEQLQVLVAKTLCIMLTKVNEISDPAEYKRYLEQYERLCRKYEYTGEPCISMRIVWNLWGGYYLCIGDYILAETAFHNALETNVADETRSLLSRVEVQSNLLLIYYMQNDIEKAYDLAEELFELIEQDEERGLIREADVYRVYTIFISMQIQNQYEAEPGERDDIIALLEKICSDILMADIREVSQAQVIFVVIAIFYLLQQEKDYVEEQRYFSAVLFKIEQQKQMFGFTPVQLMILYYCQALLQWNTQGENVGDYFRKAIDICQKSSVQHNQRAEIMRSYAAFLCGCGEYETGYRYLEMSFHEITMLWHQYVRYLNDARLLNILVPVQMEFLNGYSVVRQVKDISTCYEKVLQFKALASLAGRERNRVIHAGHFNAELLDEIHQIQNAIAAQEAESMLRNVGWNDETLESKLRYMETEFATCFPENIEFKNISLKTVQSAIPDDSVVLEYFLALDHSGQSQYEDPDGDCSVIDVYITTKVSGKCDLQRIIIMNGLEVIEDAREFVAIMECMSTGDITIEDMEKVEQIRFRLYNALIAPVLGYMKKDRTIYIAPDNELINLPFDILYNEDKIRLADLYHCVKIECARDFLFATQKNTNGGKTLIVSAPEYEIKERVIERERSDDEESDFERVGGLDLDALGALPFSRVEAYRVRKRIGGVAYIGEEATKQAVLSAKGYENIHIATHGYFDLDNTYDSLYSSCLVFAGIKNWYRTGKINPEYGSGLLTADEVSRMDLSSTNMVVLSSCLSGMNDVWFHTGFYGMVSALSAAGTKYVISNLWCVNDFASAVFMDAFYYFYTNGCSEPSVALNKARNYLRSANIDELRRQGWFRPEIYRMLDPGSRDFLYDLENKNGKLRPFRNEAFWGGFTCYECY